MGPMQHPVITREAWLEARQELLAKERAVMQAMDAPVRSSAPCPG